MSQVRANSSPELAAASSSRPIERPDDLTLEGISTNVKLLLKLIQDHNEASTRDQDDRKVQRVASMMTILDDVKTRIQKSTVTKRRTAELRRCNTDLRPNRAPRERKPTEPITDEKEKLRRQLSASLAARKSLEIMCSSLGKEKEIIASELARKVQELNGMEELVNDLKAQNEMLLGKVKLCAAEHKEKKCDNNCNSSEQEELQLNNAALQERNKALSEQLLRSLDGYRLLKRRYREAQEKNITTHVAMEELAVEVAQGIDQFRELKRRLATQEEPVANIEEEMARLEKMFGSLDMKISEHVKKKGNKC